MSTHQPPSLLGLPREIRDEIWKYVLSGWKIEIATCWFGKCPRKKASFCHQFIESVTERAANKSITFLRRTRIDPQNPHVVSCARPSAFRRRHFASLLKVNRQISLEATVILYSTNVFCFRHEQILRQWISNLGNQQRSYVKAISLDNLPLDCVRRVDPTQLPALDTVHVAVWMFRTARVSALRSMRDAFKPVVFFLKQGVKLKHMPISMMITIRDEDLAWWWTKKRKDRLEEGFETVRKVVKSINTSGHMGDIEVEQVEIEILRPAQLIWG